MGKVGVFIQCVNGVIIFAGEAVLMSNCALRPTDPAKNPHVYSLSIYPERKHVTNIIEVDYTSQSLALIESMVFNRIVCCIDTNPVSFVPFIHNNSQ